METTAEQLLALFERLPKAGLQRIVAERNPGRARGLHLLETSHVEARALLADVGASGNLGAVVDCLRFVPGEGDAAGRFTSAADDPSFAHCVATHDPRAHVPLMLWMHAGDNAAHNPRPRDDFCVKWAVISI